MAARLYCLYCTPLVKPDLSWIKVFVHSQPNLLNISGFMSKRRESCSTHPGLGCTCIGGSGGLQAGCPESGLHLVTRSCCVQASGQIGSHLAHFPWQLVKSVVTDWMHKSLAAFTFSFLQLLNVSAQSFELVLCFF